MGVPGAASLALLTIAGALLAKLLHFLLAFVHKNKVLKQMPHVGKGLLGWKEFVDRPDLFSQLLAAKANELGGGCNAA